MRCEPFCPCVPRPITVKTTSGADAMATVDSISVWLDKRGNAKFLTTSKNVSLIRLQKYTHTYSYL